MSVRAAVASVLAISLAFAPRVASAAQPIAPDRDVDGVSDATDMCPDTYGAPPSGCPPQAQPVVIDTDGDGVPDSSDACVNEAGAPSNGCPIVAPPPAQTPLPPAGDPNDEYQTLLRTLPNDYDINYTFDAPDKKRYRENNPGRAAKNLRNFGLAGSTLLLLGTVGLAITLPTGLVMARNAKDDLEGMRDDQAAIPPVEPDYETREEALEKGETGDRVAIFGSAASGAVMAVGTVLLLAARSIKRKQYGAPSGSGAGMTDKSKRNLTLGGTLLVLYGLVFVGVGAVLARNDDATKQKNGKILLGIGGGMSGLGLLLFIPLLTNKYKKTANMQLGPMWVRGGSGAGMRMRF
jgi:hypothetical protein